MPVRINNNVLIGILFLIITNIDNNRSKALAGDCNGNGIDDSCDVSCSNPGCYEIEGCGLQLDCDGNGTPGECDVYILYAGTQGGAGIGRVYQYLGEIDPLEPANNWRDLTPSPEWDVAAVMDLVAFEGKLYAGVQTAHGLGGGGGEGHVWRLDLDGWIRVTPDALDRSVMVLEVLV